MSYQISVRQKKLLQLLSRESIMTGDVLASLLSVTARTVRTEVTAINAVFGKAIIISSPKGYSIDPQYYSLTKDAVTYADNNALQIQLTWEIFSGKCSNKAAELAEKYYVNTAVIYQLLKKISENLSTYQLQLVKDGVFYHVDGSEFARRIFLNTMILADIHSDMFDVESYNALFENIDVRRIRSALLEILFENNLQPTEVNLDSLTLNVAIAFDRLLKKQPITTISHQLPDDKDSPEYLSAQAIALLFEQRYHIAVPKNDITYFYLLVFGQTRRRYENLLDEAFLNTVDRILEETFKNFNLVCPYSIVLENLAYHIYFLLIRCKIGTITYNSLLDNLRVTAPFIYDVAVTLAELIRREFSVVVADSEIGYLALVLGGMLENSDSGNVKINTVIVCGWHETVGQNIQEKLSNIFPDALSFLGTIPQLPHTAAESRNVLFLSCLSQPVPYPNVISISAIVANRDINEIKKYISDYQKKQSKKQLHALTREFLDERLFFHNIRFEDKYDAIRFLAGKAVELGYAPPEMTDEILQRERASSTCFLDAFAIPHPLNFPAERSAMCVLSLDEPIPWDEHQIKFVCLLVLSRKDRDRFHKLYQPLVELLCDMQYLTLLAAAPTFDEFVKQIDLLISEKT